MDNIEHNLSKIEETSMAIPDIERKISKLKRDQSKKLEILNFCAEYVESQFSAASSSVVKILKSDRSSVLINEELNFKSLEILSKKTKFKDVQAIVEKLDFSSYLQTILEGFVKITMNKAKNFLSNAILEKVGNYFLKKL